MRVKSRTGHAATSGFQRSASPEVSLIRLRLHHWIQVSGCRRKSSGEAPSRERPYSIPVFDRTTNPLPAGYPEHSHLGRGTDMPAFLTRAILGRLFERASTVALIHIRTLQGAGHREKEKTRGYSMERTDFAVLESGITSGSAARGGEPAAIRQDGWNLSN